MKKQSKYETPEQKVTRITNKIFVEQQSKFKMIEEELINLKEQILHLERKFIENTPIGEFDLFSTRKSMDTPKEKNILENGVEYINKITYVEFRKDFFWEERKEWMNTYIIQLEDVDGFYQITVFSVSEQPEENNYIRHTVKGKEIKQFKFI